MLIAGQFNETFIIAGLKLAAESKKKVEAIKSKFADFKMSPISDAIVNSHQIVMDI